MQAVNIPDRVRLSIGFLERVVLAPAIFQDGLELYLRARTGISNAHSGFGEHRRRPPTRKRDSVRWPDESGEIQIDRLYRRIGFRQTARTRRRPAYCPWASD